jgi:hypothetical protein
MERGYSQQAYALPGRKNNRHRSAGESEKGGMKKTACFNSFDDYNVNQRL